MKTFWKKLFSKQEEKTEIELHVAGATVRYRNPFEDLKVNRNEFDLEEEFIEKWVVPFYMNGFSNLTKDDEKSFVEIYSQINDEVVTKLLGDFNWRTRIVGAYFSALKESVEFEDEIGKHLLKSELCYAGRGYCLALASFRTEKSKEFLKKYLDYYLTRTDLWFDQSDALSALFCTDEKEADNYKTLWRDFTADKSNWNLEKSNENFAKSLTNLERIKKLAVENKKAE